MDVLIYVEELSEERKSSVLLMSDTKPERLHSELSGLVLANISTLYLERIKVY